MACKKTCRCSCRSRAPGRSSGTTEALRTTPSRAYVEAVGVDAPQDRLARLENAGMPAFVASHVLSHTPRS